jgi:2-keto-4-pentenoate hydratase/2-oxohepta-3-ene-1,7-dioic acid hydratase in catechol pathway
MRILRFRRDSESPATWGWLDDDHIGIIDSSPYEAFRRETAEIPLDEVELLAPVLPDQIIGIGRNFAAHADEFGFEVPELPLIFLKPPSCVIGNGSPILLPPQSNQVEHEAELAVVIGRRGRWIEPDDAFEYILGYTIANDVTARDIQRGDETWTRGKGFDTFCPIGPWIETKLDPSDLVITCKVNEQMRQMASTRDMIFTIPHLLAFISSVMTLEPGSVILTGTPSGVGALTEGDEVTIEIEGLGVLTNPVRSDPRGVNL